MIKLYYARDNANNNVFYRNDDLNRYESYICDGSDDFPILSDEDSALEYLKKIAEDHENLGGADDCAESGEEFAKCIEWFNDNYPVCKIIAEYTVKRDRHFYVIDNCLSSKSEIFDEKIVAVSKAEAKRIAQREWDHLSAHDQGERDAFYLASAEEDEDGCIDWDTVEEILVLK